MGWTKKQKFELISLVRDRNSLWDSRSSDHSKKNVTRENWSAVAIEMGFSGAVCIKQWRAIRNYYMKLRNALRSNKSGDGYDESTVPTWQFYKELEFLDDTLIHRPSISNLSQETVEDDMDETDVPGSGSGHDVEYFEEEELLDLESNLPELGSTQNNHTANAESDQTGISQNSVSPASTNQNAKAISPQLYSRQKPLSAKTERNLAKEERKATIGFMATVSDTLKRKSTQSMDECFLEQLGGHLKGVPDGRRKEEFKIKVLQDFIDFRFQNLDT